MPESISSAAPVKPTWIVLGIAWLLCLIPIPGFGIIGLTVNIAAFVLAIIVLVKGKTGQGVIQLVASVLITPIMYIIGLALFGSIFGTAIQETKYQLHQNSTITPYPTRQGNLPPIKWPPQSHPTNN